MISILFLNSFDWFEQSIDLSHNYKAEVTENVVMFFFVEGLKNDPKLKVWDLRIKFGHVFRTS